MTVGATVRELKVPTSDELIVGSDEEVVVCAYGSTYESKLCGAITSSTLYL